MPVKRVDRSQVGIPVNVSEADIVYNASTDEITLAHIVTGNKRHWLLHPVLVFMYGVLAGTLVTGWNIFR